MTDQEQAEKLKRELDRLGLPNREPGDARNRARIFGVSAPMMRHYTSGRKRIPNWLWSFLKLWELSGSEAREELALWARDCAERGSYVPPD